MIHRSRPFSLLFFFRPPRSRYTDWWPRARARLCRVDGAVPGLRRRPERRYGADGPWESGTTRPFRGDRPGGTVTWLGALAPGSPGLSTRWRWGSGAPSPVAPRAPRERHREKWGARGAAWRRA